MPKGIFFLLAGDKKRINLFALWADSFINCDSVDTLRSKGDIDTDIDDKDQTDI